MPTLQEAHAANYSDMPFEEFAQRVYQKHYSDMSYEQFAQKAGVPLNPVTPPLYNDRDQNVANVPRTPEPAPTGLASLPGAAANLVSGAAGAVAPAAKAVDSVVANVLRGARTGVANIVGLPVDAVNAAPMALNLIPGVSGVGPMSPNPIGGSKSIDTALGLGVVPEPPVNNAVDRYARRIGTELGAAAVPGSVAMRAASKLGVEGARRLPGVVGSVVARAANNPGKFIAAEGATAAAAGLGGQAASDAATASGAAPGSAGAIAADLAGSIAGAMGLNAAARLGPKAIRMKQAVRKDPNFDSPAVREAVTDDLAKASGMTPDELARKIDNTPSPAEVVPGYADNLAERTQNPGLASALRGKELGGDGALAARADANINAVNRAMSASAPAADTPGAFRSALDDNRTAAVAQADNSVAAAKAAVDDALAALPQAGTATARGSNIREALTDALAKARDYERKAWQAVRGAGTVEVDDLVRRFKNVSKSVGPFKKQYIPGEVTGKLNTLTQPTEASVAAQAEKLVDAFFKTGETSVGSRKPLPVRDLLDLRSELSTLAREAASGLQPNRETARIINKYVAAVDAFAAKNPGISEGWKAARAVSRDLNDRFTRPQTAVAQTLAKQQSTPTVDASAVPGKFVQPDQGRVTDFRRLMREAGDDPRARSAVEGQIVADVEAKGLANKPEQLRRYLNQRNIVLGEFPDLRRQLNELADRRTAATTAEQGRDATVSQIDKGPVGKYLQYGDEKATEAMGTVLASKDPKAAIDELIRFSGGGKDAIEGAKRALWSNMEKSALSKGEATSSLSGAKAWRPAALAEFLQKPGNKAVMERLYADNPEHLQNLNKIADAIKGANTTTKVQVGSGTAAGMKANENLPSVETLGSRFYAFKRGQVGAGYLIGNITAIIGRRSLKMAEGQQYVNLMREALLNPDMASLLLKQNNPANRALLRKSSKLWQGSAGSKLIDLLEAESAPNEDDRRTLTIRKRVLRPQ